MIASVSSAGWSHPLSNRQHGQSLVAPDRSNSASTSPPTRARAPSEADEEARGFSSARSHPAGCSRNTPQSRPSNAARNNTPRPRNFLGREQVDSWSAGRVRMVRYRRSQQTQSAARRTTAGSIALHGRGRSSAHSPHVTVCQQPVQTPALANVRVRVAAVVEDVGAVVTGV